jgi:hypothetical protein
LDPHFILTDQYVKIRCDLKQPDGELVYPDVWVECRKNLSIGEQRALIDGLKELNDELTELFDNQMDAAEEIDVEHLALRTRPADLPDEETWLPDSKALRANAKRGRSLQDTVNARATEIQRERRALVTKYIKGWNLFALGDDGAPIPLPAPREGGLESLESVASDLADWMITKCTLAYRSGKALGSGMKSAAEPEPGPEQIAGGPKVIPSSNSRRSRKS